MQDSVPDFVAELDKTSQKLENVVIAPLNRENLLLGAKFNILKKNTFLCFFLTVLAVMFHHTLAKALPFQII